MGASGEPRQQLNTEGRGRNEPRQPSTEGRGGGQEPRNMNRGGGETRQAPARTETAQRRPPVMVESEFGAPTIRVAVLKDARSLRIGSGSCVSCQRKINGRRSRFGIRHLGANQAGCANWQGMDWPRLGQTLVWLAQFQKNSQFFERMLR